METEIQDTIKVPGAFLFYRRRGNGPVLLIMAGGDTDADMTDLLCDNLKANYSVVSYDRRGLSRSVIEGNVKQMDIKTHAADAHRLISHITHEPVYIFGNSIGALAGLELAAQYPEQVRMLVAHEAPTRLLLPADEWEALAHAQSEMQETFEREGLEASLEKSAKLAAIDVNDHEPGVLTAPMTDQRKRNLTFLQKYDVPAVRRYEPDAEKLKNVATKIIPAAGETTKQTLLHHCADALAKTLGKQVALFPGGHTGWLLKPKAFAFALHETFRNS